MDPSTQELQMKVLLVLVALGIWACALVWFRVAVCIMRGVPVVRYQPRRPVPWLWIDVVAVFFLSIAISVLVAGAGRSWFGLGAIGPVAVEAEVADEAAPNTEHPIGQLLTGDHGGWVFALCVRAAVVMAPVVEEFLFRLVLQGWLEAVERRRRRRRIGRGMGELFSAPPPEPVDPDNPYVSPGDEGAVAVPPGFAHAARSRPGLLTVGVLPVFISSLFFASLHFRTAGPALPLEEQVFLIVVLQVSSVFILAAAVAFLRLRAGATLSDFGIVPGRLLADVRLGLVAYVAICAPVYVLMFLVKSIAPESWVVDPIPLFPLAVMLGFLYYRTHRIVPSIVTHAAFNGTTVFLAWLTMG